MPPWPHRRSSLVARPARSWPGRRSSASTPTGSGSARSATSRSSARCCEPGHAVHDRLRRSRSAGSSLNLRVALGVDRRPAPGVHDARRHRGRAAGRPAAAHARHSASPPLLAVAHRPLRGRPVGDVADLAECACRSARPIRSSAATSASTSSRCRSCSSCAASAQALVVLAALAPAALYLVSGSLTSGFPAPHVDDAGGAPPSVAARRRRSCCCWRWAPGCSRAEHLVRAVRH